MRPRMRSSNLVKFNLLILLAGLLSFGCAGTPNAPDTEASSAELESNEPTSRWLVWGHFDGDVSTYEVQVQGQQAEIVETYPQIRIATSNGVWQWSVEETDVVQADCACFMETFHEGREVGEGDCQADTTQERGAFYELGGDRSWAPEVLGDDETDTEYSPSFQVTGSMGSRAFVTTCVFLYACGAAHPSTVCESTIVDLETLETWHPSELVKPVEDPSMMTFESEDANPDRNGAELVEFAVRASPQGALLDHRYVTGTCYACSDGEWSSYTSSAVVEGRPVEGVLEADAELNPALLDIVEDLGPANVKGWSKLDP